MSEISVASTTIQSGCEEDGNCVRDKGNSSSLSRLFRDVSVGIFAASSKLKDDVSWLSRHGEWRIEDRTSTRVVLKIVCMLRDIWCVADTNSNSNMYIIITTRHEQ